VDITRALNISETRHIKMDDGDDSVEISKIVNDI